ncbi:MAG: flagellar basal-body MS-ring/collar protein FliF [Oscillospiraceae bacterium]
MLDQIKGATTNINTYWKKQPSKNKKIFIGGVGLVLVVAIIITVALNFSANKFEVLYPGVTSNESAEVYASLQAKGVEAKLNASGEVLVPKEQWDSLVFQLAAEGFPKTAPAYGIFLDNIGPTTTEYEKREIKRFQLQDRIQETLKQIDGIQGAIVTINLPEQSDRVWETEKSVATAAVLLNLKSSGELAPDKVTTIKKLVAAALPNGKSENVMVTDAATSVELDDNPANGSSYSLKRLEFEDKIQKNIEDNIKRLFTPTYGPNGVVAVATVVLDYDKMKSESREVVPKEDGSGVIKHEDESYTANGGIPTGGIAGEENNTDIPEYVANSDATKDNITSYDKNIDYDLSYIMTQIERGEAPIKKSTISVIVDESNITADRREVIVDLVSKAVNIEPEFISVSSMNLKTDTTDPEIPANTIPFYKNTKLLTMVGGIIFALLLLIIAISIIISKGRKRKAAKEEALLLQQQAEQINAAQKAQAEIDQHKSKLRNEAEAQKIQEGSMTEEIRSFTKENPEMAAVLIRSLLKEDE